MRSAGFIVALISPSLALAQTAAPADSMANSQLASFVPMLGIFALFYLLLIRPQQKRMKEHQQLLAQLAKGDEVVTSGGIIGKITKADAASDQCTVEIAKGVEVLVVRSTISSVVGKTAAKPAPAEKKKGANKNDNAVVSRENVANDN